MKMIVRIILLKSILLFFESNLIHAQEAEFKDKIASDQYILIPVNNTSINQHSKPFLIDEHSLINPSNLQYDEKVISLENSFELSAIPSPTLEAFASHTLNGDYLILPNDSPSLSPELGPVSQNYQQIDKQNSLHNLHGGNINNSSPVNLWNLTDKYLALSPFSWHIDYTEPDVNNFPMGVGAAYDFEIINPNYGFFNHLIQDSIVSLEFNIFRDSDFGYPAGYVGLSLRRNIFASPIQVGSAIGLLHTTQLQELSGSPVLPFMLPFLQTDFDIPVNLRIVYIPSFADYNSQQVFFTLMIKIN
jgi:hypothetical protein